MSYDIFVQAFESGEAVDRDSAEVRRLLLAHTDNHDPARGFAHIVYGDGQADVYGIPAQGAPLRSLLFNHASGDAFDLIVDAARAADLVVLPVDCPACIVSDGQRAHLPAELTVPGVELVTSGADLR